MIRVRTLVDGGQGAETVAGWVTGFLDGATASLDIALYDLEVADRAEQEVFGALRRAVNRGVSVRILYNLDTSNPIPVPPPPRTDPQKLAAMGLPVRSISGVPDLMHHKFVVRDGEAVWTGSTNWTDDSWTREENLIAEVSSSQIAEAFSRDYQELWDSGQVSGTGKADPEPTPLYGTGEIDGARLQLDGGTAAAWFCPGRGRRISHRIAAAIGRATSRVRVCSPVITSGPILGTLTEAASEGRLDLAGACDSTQMQEVLQQWHVDGHSPWKISAFLSLAGAAPFSGKQSTPYGPGTVHDYMHAKVLVADDIVFLGSYNLSHSGEQNAENVLEITNRGMADALAEYVDRVRSRYPPLRLVNPERPAMH
jgi:hypothetical protein